MNPHIPGTVLVAVACAAFTAAQADDRLLLTGGEVADSSYYSYVGTVLPLKDLGNGSRLVQRYWLDVNGYEYDGAPGRVEADAWGGEAALGYVRSSAAGWGEASVGVRYTDTDLSPDDPSAGARGQQTGIKLQLQGERDLGGWRGGAILSWANQQNEYWSRVRLSHPVSAATSLGGEFIAGGNDETDYTLAGLVLRVGPAESPWSVGLRGGYRWQDDDDGAYGGLELGFSF